MDVTVRTATPEDAETVAAVHRTAIERLVARQYGEDVVAAWLEWVDPQGYPVEGDGRFVVAEADDCVVGFGHLRAEPRDHLTAAVAGEVGAVYVHPDATRQGVGSAVLADLEEHARIREIGSLGVLSSVNAVPFYGANGYERVDERSVEFGDGATGPVVEMRKGLETE